MENLSAAPQSDQAATSRILMEESSRFDSLIPTGRALKDSLHKNVLRRIRQRRQTIRNWKKPVLQIPFHVKFVSMPERDPFLGHFFMVSGELGESLQISSGSRKVIYQTKHSLIRSMMSRRRLPFAHKTPKQMVKEAGWQS